MLSLSIEQFRKIHVFSSIGSERRNNAPAASIAFPSRSIVVRHLNECKLLASKRHDFEVMLQYFSESSVSLPQYDKLDQNIFDSVHSPVW